MWPFRAKHPFPLTRISREGRENRRELEKQIRRWQALLGHAASNNVSTPITINSGGRFHLLRLENFSKPLGSSKYDNSADLLKHSFEKRGWFMVGRVYFNLLDDKITSMRLVHLKAEKVIQGSNEGL